MTHTFIEDGDLEPSCWRIRKHGFRKLNRVGAVNGVRFCQKTFDSELADTLSASSSSCSLEFSQSAYSRNEDVVDGWVKHARRLTLPRKTVGACRQCLRNSYRRSKLPSTQATRDLWWGKLNEVVTSEREKEPKSTNIQVRFNDMSTGIEYTKTFSVGAHDSASRCIALALQHLEMRGRDPTDFQLWAKTSGDEAPYPLIGHERPFAIKLSCLRQGLSAEEGFDLDHCNNLNGPDPYTRCMFILKSKPRLPETPEPESKKHLKKTRKSPMRIRQVFRRSLQKEESDPSGLLFKLPLDKVFEGDLPPKPVMAMLQQVFQKGPFTQGIFRKSASARLVKELREQLDSGLEVALDVVPVLVTAALLKDFLRSLPTPLLGGNLSTDWFDAVVAASPQERLLRIRNLVAQLPANNQTLLAYFLCVLHHVARRASHNLMTAANLGVCVGPSLLWSPCLTPTATKAVPLLVETLITHCDTIVGPNVRHLLGDPPERPPDSGAEESDSLHSGGLRRDDSSIDSLERELSEPPRKDKISLSRDSGLTMSDSQLYTPDEEETSSSSSGSGHNYTSANRPNGHTPASPGFNPASPPPRQQYITHSKVSASYSVPVNPSLPNLGQSVLSNGPEYVRVYGGWEERVQGYCRPAVYPPGRSAANPHFQREAWFRQRSTQRRQPRGTESSPPPDAGSSTLSDDDSTPHVSRSNSRGKDDERVVHAAPATVTAAPPLPPKRAPLRHLPPVHVEDVQDENRPPERRGRLRRRDMVHKALAHRSKSLPPAEDTGGIYSRLQDVEVTRSVSNKVSVESPPPYRPPPRAPSTYCVDRRVLVDHQEESYV